MFLLHICKIILYRIADISDPVLLWFSLSRLIMTQHKIMILNLGLVLHDINLGHFGFDEKYG